MATTALQVVPFTTYVVKVASRCNLNCSYCYMYNLADKTYKGQPPIMLDDVTAALAQRILTHCVKHRQTGVHIILHGGEPLLMPKPALVAWVRRMRDALLPDVRPAFSVQSNGTLIDDEWVDLLSAEGVRIGISIDGPQERHDRHRVNHLGEGSFDAVLRGVRTLQAHARGPSIFSSVMGVVDVSISPKELFDFWNFLDVEGFDLSLPHANHLHPPPAPVAAYGEWMIEFFDLWLQQNRRDRRVRYFDNILRMLFGYPVSTDNIGGKPVGVVVVETDGGLEPTDAFKCCEHGITKVGLNVKTADLDELYDIPMINVLQAGAPQLCNTCQSCIARDVCGGGYMPHRYSKDRGFDNPSVYCEALLALALHARNRAIESLPQDLADDLGVSHVVSA